MALIASNKSVENDDDDDAEEDEIPTIYDSR